MTGLSVMEQSLPDDQSRAEKTALPVLELDCNFYPTSKEHSAPVSENSIATLDVTAEEINVSNVSHKHSPQQYSYSHCSPSSSAEALHNLQTERKRSETWSAGITPLTNNFKNSNSFHSDITLDRSTHDVTQHNGFYDSSESDNMSPLKREEVQMQSLQLSEGKPGFAIQGFNSQPPLDNLTPQKITSNSHFSASSNSLDFENVQIENDEIPDVHKESEFTDISLQPSGETKIDKDTSDSLPTSTSAVPLGRSSLGNLFGWVSTSKPLSTTPSLQTSPLKDPSNNSVDLPINSNDVGSSFPNANGQVEGNVLYQSKPYVQTENVSIQGLKLIGKSLKLSWTSKSRFWRNRASEPLSTTALILENRPRNLPSKSEEEAERHRLEYEQMVGNAKKHEQRDLLKKKKLMKQQRKQEETIVNASSIWSSEILPNWNTMHQTNKTRQLWWQGLPPSVRGKVWHLAIGNELNITQDLYDIMVTRAHDKLRSLSETQSMTGEDTESLAVDRESTVELIRLDISRTFPYLCIFQTGGPYHDVLHDILGAYVCYRPDVGYVQGMSFIAAVLLLNMDPANAFITFANLMNKPCQVAFFRLDEELMKTYFATFEVFFEENLPKLFAHFKLHNLTPDMYLIDWIFTMFSKALSLDAACRVWDIFCRDGEEFLFKTALSILKLHSDVLLDMEFIYAAQFLTRLPNQGTSYQQLFDHMTDISMVSRGNRRWKDVLSLMRDVS